MMRCHVGALLQCSMMEELVLRKVELTSYGR